MFKRLAAAALSVLLALTGGAATAATKPVVLNGEINRLSATTALAALQAGDQPLIVTSRGGEPGAALDLADYLRAHQTPVIVRGYCMSACASYVLPASPRTRVEDHAVVLFHNTMTSMFHVAATRPEVAEAFFGAQMRRERAFYAAGGLGPELLLAGQIAVNPHCWGAVMDLERKPYSIFVNSDLDGVAFPASQLRRLGYRFKGRIAETRAEFAADAARNWRGPPLNAVLTYPSPGTYDDLASALAATPACGFALTAPRPALF